MAGTDLFSHIRAMCWTTGPTYIIVMGIAMYMESQYASGTLDAAKITAMQTVMASESHISLLGFLPPLVVIGTALAKIPALPGLFAGVIVARHGGVPGARGWAALSAWSLKGMFLHFC